MKCCQFPVFHIFSASHNTAREPCQEVSSKPNSPQRCECKISWTNYKFIWDTELNENGRRTRFVNWCSNLVLCSRLSTSVLTSNCEKNSPKLSLHVAQAKDEPWQTCLSARHFKLKLEVSKLRQCEIPNKDIVFYGMTWLNFALKRTRNHWW